VAVDSLLCWLSLEWIATAVVAMLRGFGVSSNEWIGTVVGCGLL
jgi:hypothetical protein